MTDAKVTIIGTGALGSTLARALHKKGITVFSLFNRSEEKLSELRAALAPAFSGKFPQTGEELGNIIFITVSDDAIPLVINKLSYSTDNFSNVVTAHCSGTLSSSVLAPLAKKGANVAAFHPVQTFSNQSKPSDFNNIYVDIEGDEIATSSLRALAEQIGANCLEISSDAKPYLHAAGVIASNYLLTLLDQAVTVAREGGIKKELAVKSLLPLMRKTLHNAESADQLHEALSGPIARGDTETVKKHLKLLEANPDMRGLYKTLGKRTLQLAEGGKRRTKSNDQMLKQLSEDE